MMSNDDDTTAESGSELPLEPSAKQERVLTPPVTSGKMAVVYATPPSKVKLRARASAGVSARRSAATPHSEGHTESDDSDDLPGAGLKNYQEFFIPISGFVSFTEEELQIIDHPAFQRLAKIYQLGQSYLVYRGATHKRFEHVLGTVHVAQKMVEAVHENFEQFEAKGLAELTRCSFEAPLSLAETRFIRLAALLHDIGHLPAGHTLEDELCLLEPHDANQRLKLVFQKTDWVSGVVSPALGPLIDDLYKNCLPSGIKPQDIVRQIISKDEAPQAEVGSIRIHVCRDIVGNTICADLLDYLNRDWHHIGKPRFFETRLFQYMQIRRDTLDGQQKFVISYGQGKRPKSDVVSSVLELLESRYNLAEAVLFHSTKCAAAAMLERGVSELYLSLPEAERQPWLASLENELLSYSDAEMLSSMLKKCEQLNCISGKGLFQALALRHVYKSVCLVMKDGIDAGVRNILLQRFVGEFPDGRKVAIKDKREAAARRAKALATFENDFGLVNGSVVLYCPPAKMNSKIAEVKIIRRDGILTLADWDAKENLAGGHCQAQLERFERLWRVEVFLSKAQKVLLSEPELSLINRGIRVLLLGLSDDGDLTDAAALQIARELSVQKGGRYYGKEVSLPLAARDGLSTYPMGAPTIRSLFGME